MKGTPIGIQRPALTADSRHSGGVRFMNNEYAEAVFKSALPDCVKQEDKQNSENKDTFRLSPEAQRKAELARLKEEMKNADEQAEAAGESMKILSRCIKIATRILNGDKVPLKDMKYLQENEPDMFKQAITLRRINPEPKEYDSVLEDEEEDKTENTQASDGTAADNSSAPSGTSPDAPADSPAPQTSVDISC